MKKMSIPDKQVLDCAYLQHLPPSLANNLEAADYIRHYFGLECYDRWQRQQEQACTLLPSLHKK